MFPAAVSPEACDVDSSGGTWSHQIGMSGNFIGAFDSVERAAWEGARQGHGNHFANNTVCIMVRRDLGHGYDYRFVTVERRPVTWGELWPWLFLLLCWLVVGVLLGCLVWGNL